MSIIAIIAIAFASFFGAQLAIGFPARAVWSSAWQSFTHSIMTGYRACGMRGSFAVITVALGTVVCACQAPAGRPPMTAEQVTLAGLDTLLSGAGMASDACMLVMLCAPFAPAIATALNIAEKAAAAAEVPVFGCPEAVWRDATQVCGTPAEDMSLQARVITDASAAVSAARALIPVFGSAQ